MSWSHLLLRLLLAACLILNGVGASVAAVSMQLEVPDSAPDSTTIVRDVTFVDGTAPAQVAMADDHCVDQSAVDCCDPERCDGACAQAATALLSFASTPSPPILGMQLAEPPVATRAGPDLPQPVRPPIA